VNAFARRLTAQRSWPAKREALTETTPPPENAGESIPSFAPAGNAEASVEVQLFKQKDQKAIQPSTEQEIGTPHD
jgi:hypothetical protein